MLKKKVKKNDPEKWRSTGAKEIRKKIYAFLFHERMRMARLERSFIEKETQGREREGKTRMKGEFDACLVIQVAGNDFTSSNLRIYAFFFILCGDFIAYIENGMFMMEQTQGKTIILAKPKRGLMFVR